MVEIRPVELWHPAAGRFEASQLVCPVYDTLTSQQLELYSSLPYNAARFVARPPSQSTEAFVVEAQRALREAKQAGAYERESPPSLYVYGIEYVPLPDVGEMIPARKARSRYLLLGLVGALDLSKSGDYVAMHEATYPERVAERVSLTRGTGTHFAPIVAGYSLATHAINDRLEEVLGLHRRSLTFASRVGPIVEATLAGSRHRLWKLTDPKLVDELTSLVRPLRLLVLDGHHRFTAARERLSEGIATQPLVMLVETRDRALLLFPWHRVAGPDQLGWSRWQQVSEETELRVTSLGDAPPVETLIPELNRLAEGPRCSFVAVGVDGAMVVEGSNRELPDSDFRLLSSLLEGRFSVPPERLLQPPSVRAAVREVRAPDSRYHGGVAFIMPPLSLDALETAVFRTQNLMVAKSTLFLPKVIDGLMFAPETGGSVPGA